MGRGRRQRLVRIVCQIQAHAVIGRQHLWTIRKIKLTLVPRFGKVEVESINRSTRIFRSAAGGCMFADGFCKPKKDIIFV
jgi:hypothetical protein